MEAVYEEKKKAIDGVSYPFDSHKQKHHGRGIMANAHIHDYIEILYCLSGELEVYLNFTKYSFKSGDMIIINSREVHNITAISQGINEYIVVKFEPEMLYTTSQTIFEVKYILPFTLSSSTHQKLFSDREIKKTLVPNLVSEIYYEFSNKSYGYELSIRANICSLFLWILRRWKEQGVDLNIGYVVNENIIKRLQIVIDYVRENHQSHISAADMAKLCNMSYSYFSRFFKMILKRNFSEYLNSVRITAAEKLLTTTDLNITEIAMAVGFSTSSYFIQQFKSHKNISPMKYRKLF